MRVLNCRDRQERDELLSSAGKLGGMVKPQTGDDDTPLVEKKRITDLRRYFSRYWSVLV